MPEAESKLDELKRLWMDPHASKGYIRERLGWSYKQVEESAKFLGLPEKPTARNGEEYWPTEAEIEQKLAEIRAKWSQGRRDGRETSASRIPADIRVYSYSSRTGVFS